MLSVATGHVLRPIGPSTIPKEQGGAKEVTSPWYNFCHFRHFMSDWAAILHTYQWCPEHSLIKIRLCVNASPCASERLIPLWTIKDEILPSSREARMNYRFGCDKLLSSKMGRQKVGSWNENESQKSLRNGMCSLSPNAAHYVYLSYCTPASTSRSLRAIHKFMLIETIWSE